MTVEQALNTITNGGLKDKAINLARLNGTLQKQVPFPSDALLIAFPWSKDVRMWRTLHKQLLEIESNTTIK